jgi:hypothetical protein
MAAMDHKDDSELGADAFSTGKNWHDFFRAGVGGNIVIGWFKTHHHVTNTSANEIRFITSTPKFFDDCNGGVRFHADMIAFLLEERCHSKVSIFIESTIC